MCGSTADTCSCVFLRDPSGAFFLHEVDMDRVVGLVLLSCTHWCFQRTRQARKSLFNLHTEVVAQQVASIGKSPRACRRVVKAVNMTAPSLSHQDVCGLNPKSMRGHLKSCVCCYPLFKPSSLHLMSHFACCTSLAQSSPKKWT